MIIQTKTNLFLWLLTGRSSDFVSPVLNTGVIYPTVSPSDAVVAARNHLRLLDARTDMFALGALAAAYASMPVLRSLPEDVQTAFRPNVVSLPSVSVTGATLLPPDGTSWPRISNTEHAANVFTTVTITKDGSDAVITTDAGTSARVEFTFSEGRLDVPAVFNFGVRAAFLRETWEDGDSIVVSNPPSRYPFRAMADSLSNVPGALNLMTQAGTIEAFSTSTNYVRKVGAMSAAIMLSVFRATRASIDASIDDDTLTDDLNRFRREPPNSFIADYQLMVDWAPIFLDGAPVTYNPMPT